MPNEDLLRLRHIRQIIAAFQPNPMGMPEPDYITGKLILVERSTYNTSYYISGHVSVEEAARYLNMQEYPGDYDVVGLYDSLTGDRWEEEVKRSFTPANGQFTFNDKEEDNATA